MADSQKDGPYRTLFESMREGFALYEIIVDERGQACDYRFLDVNPAFEEQTALKRRDIVGKTVREVFPHLADEWLHTFGEAAVACGSTRFEYHPPPRRPVLRCQRIQS